MGGLLAVAVIGATAGTVPSGRKPSSGDSSGTPGTPALATLIDSWTTTAVPQRLEAPPRAALDPALAALLEPGAPPRQSVHRLAKSRPVRRRAAKARLRRPSRTRARAVRATRSRRGLRGARRSAPVRRTVVRHARSRPHPRAHVAYAGSYGPGSVGYDVSDYQCGDVPLRRTSIAVVQVNAGKLDRGPNPCYVRESEWAGPNLSDYIFMDVMDNERSMAALRGPASRCAPHNLSCRAFDFGWNWAIHWDRYARSRGTNPRTWWLDVETTGSWAGMATNQATILGAVEALRSQHLTVGIYSTPYQWREIAGSLTFPGVPLWVPGAGNATGPGYSATTYCSSSSESFAGGRPRIIQWGYTGSFPGAYGGWSQFDRDFAC